MTNQNNELVNRVANSGLITLKLEEYYPGETIVPFDLKDYLFQGLILKEKDFRTALKEFDWSSVKGDILAVFCSTDAIIPQWAFMLVSTSAAPYFKDIRHGQPEDITRELMIQNIRNSVEFEDFDGQRVVVKGCADIQIPSAAFVEIARGLQPYAQSIMYGEPCSTVPIFKRPRKLKKS